MAELGGMLALAILKVVGDKIGSAIGGQITLQKDFSQDLKKMKMALESVEAMLKVAERRSITEEPTRLWLKRLKEAMYDISYMIDEFEVDTLDSTQPSSRKFSFKKHLVAIIPCLLIGPKITLANMMKTMRENLEDITSQRNNFNLVENTNANELTVINIRETSSVMDDQIIGRTEERDTILASLSNNITQDMSILPIYGMGGLGKTTLVKMVFNSSHFEDYSRVWVYVSRIFDLKKIGNSIIGQLTKKESIYTEMQMIHTSLSELLADKKILIVLDDLWESEGSHLDLLKAMLKVGKGSKVVVVVTTRDEDIAKKISSIQPFKLAPMTDDMCWTVIKQKSDFESRDNKKLLEKIGEDIAIKCGGVVLVSQTLGHMLQSLTADEWVSVRDSDIWCLSTPEDTQSAHVLASLKLSYSFMPSYLKLCFAYCAIFPKGHKIPKDDLIHQWISLGFIKPTNLSSSWQLGERYIRQLLGLSFLQDSKLPLIAGVHVEHATSFTMHDLVHDLAIYVLDNEIVVKRKHGDTGGSCCHYALLDDCSKPLESFKIRALRFHDCGKMGIHDDVFSSAKYLRVLDLSQCSKIHKFPNSIGQLKQLRYLTAPRIQDEVIPDSITRLSKLIYLNLSGSSAIKALPESIGEIESLLYLDLSGCSGIKRLPESLGMLKKLVHLALSNCTSVKDVSVFLANLTELTYLNLSGCICIEELPSLFRNLKNLMYLDLSHCYNVEGTLEALGGFVKLQYLNLSTTPYQPNEHLRGSAKVISSLTELRYLNLSYCMPYIFVPPIHYSEVEQFICRISSTLSNLEHLDLSNNDSIFSIPRSLCNLRKLHILNLSHCMYLKDIPESLGTIDSLKFLYTNSCWSLMKIPQLGSSVISLPYFLVHSSGGEYRSNLPLLQPTNPNHLEISGLEQVKSVEEAEIINLMEKKMLEILKLEWTGDTERFVDDNLLLEKLVPPNTLKELEIRGYNGVSFPAWLMGQLPNLFSLVLSGLKYLEDWDNTSCSSANEEHVIESLCIRDCPKLRLKSLPPRVKCLEISNSDNVLLSWGECSTMSHTGVSSSSSVTTSLEVQLSNVPLHQRGLLPDLTDVATIHCSGLTVSPEITKRLSSLESLYLQDAGLEQPPQWLGELSKLQSLTLKYCQNMACLPHSLGELTSLQKLSITGCYGITSLPEGILELTNLQELYIKDCHVLRQWCKSEENEMMLAHIKKRHIGDDI